MRKSLLAGLFLIFAAGAVVLFIRYTLPTREISPPGREMLGQQVPTAPETKEMDLFFSDTTGRRLSLERRAVAGENEEELLRHAVEELIKGPEGEGRVRTLPESTMVRAVYLEGANVWVDLGGAIQDEHPGGAWTEVLSVYSIVNTLTENFNDIHTVQILIDGRESETLAGHVDISKPLKSRIQLLSGEWE